MIAVFHQNIRRAISAITAVRLLTEHPVSANDAFIKGTNNRPLLLAAAMSLSGKQAGPITQAHAGTHAVQLGYGADDAADDHQSLWRETCSKLRWTWINICPDTRTGRSFPLRICGLFLPF